MQELRDKSKALLERNLDAVRERIDAACDRGGRRNDPPLLVAVTKKRPVEVITALLELGVEAIGENRPEDIWKKQEAIDRPVPWHMIGHFQRKKIARTLPYLGLVHSVHDVELLAALDHRLGALEGEDPTPLPILLQINVSGETRKQGFQPIDAQDAYDIAEAFPRLDPVGLMTMAPFDAPNDELRRVFAGLREIAERIGRERVPELSMGMSSDFEIAIEEGATMVRVGSALFDGMDLDG